ncbi:MAG: beta-ketoacyl synthase chain length factor [Pseudomonadota bacterium]|nr:beta-ketoacyl synthase chain length factor [Pseudomonadota bacterium]
MRLSAFIGGIGILGPGFDNWPQAASILAGRQPYRSAPTQLPTPETLPPAERRRTGRVVKLALAIAYEAAANAEADATRIPSVFCSSGSDGHICHEICQALALSSREVSPTRFSNSVHNVAAGYWSIASGSMAQANVLCAFDASFVAGLLDALAQTAVDQQAVLLVAYDTEYPPPLYAKRPIPDAFGVAMVLTPERSSTSLAHVDLVLTDESADLIPDQGLEALRIAIPAARSLPLLRLLAMGSPGRAILDYLDVSRASVQVQPCF